ncbi:hypothetical protein [Amycolatopsis sp. FDAARGOS 1241]|nr:hypothetical protein [Amycolatopsis sp. FDAARGOS 1241]QRP43971.1 hypothetical protein I6J71_32275 [Amycolatopsis sp. FDAARGOS 1241]
MPLVRGLAIPAAPGLAGGSPAPAGFVWLLIAAAAAGAGLLRRAQSKTA